MKTQEAKDLLYKEISQERLNEPAYTCKYIGLFRWAVVFDKTVIMAGGSESMKEVAAALNGARMIGQLAGADRALELTEK